MFDTFIFKPIFNLLVVIYSLLPINDFGLSIVIFTIFVRLAMWPLIRKQLHQARVMRQLQPEIQQLRKKHAGDRRSESLAMMELYKRYGVNPFSSIGTLLIQLPIFIGLFGALRLLINDPNSLVVKTYAWVQHLPDMKAVITDLHNFNTSFLGIVDTTEYAFKDGKIVVGALLIALLAGLFQYLQAKQLAPPASKETKTFRQILRESKEGKEPDMAALNTQTARRMTLLMPVMIMFIAASSPAGLAIYFATGAAVGYLQQRVVLSRDVKEMEEMKITTTVKTMSSSTKKKASDRGQKGARRG